jgi:hypothetical protein
MRDFETDSEVQSWQEGKFLCGHPGCTEYVSSIWCKAHRVARQVISEEASHLRSERMKEMWASRHDELAAKIQSGKQAAKAGKAAATEGKDNG